MADWNRITSRGNVEDRRGMIPAVGGGIGVTGLLIVLLFNYLSGGSLGDMLSQVATTQSTQDGQSSDAGQYAGNDEYEVFASEVLGSANDMWRATFEDQHVEYREPKLVLFRTATNSACGGAQSYVGPHYCPEDETIYLDETFFEELTSKLGAQGGDVAEGYVIAHEVGHHAQKLLGELHESTSNAGSVQTELQADCYAGLWAYSIRDIGILGKGEIQEAMDAAAAVGDDRIQQKTTGAVNSETWTHGSSQDRVQAFTNGYESGALSACQS